MNCAWQEYLNLLPAWLRSEVDKRCKDTLQEVRLRQDMPVELRAKDRPLWLQRKASREDISFCINVASSYSPWAAGTFSQGYVTAAGGHRISLCGRAVVQNGVMTGITQPTSISLRVARDFLGIAGGIKTNESILILGAPGCGKTTLLRDLIRAAAEKESVSVVDERGEIFPLAHNKFCFLTGKRTDVLSGCGKRQGIEMLLRNMTPNIIAVDEITAAEDCQALLLAGWCGVRLFATAHATSRQDLLSRPVYKPLAESGLFETLLILQQDKTWDLERITL